MSQKTKIVAIKNIRVGKGYWLAHVRKGIDKKGRTFYKGEIVKRTTYGQPKGVEPEFEFWGTFDNFANNRDELVAQIIKRLRKQKDWK